jgi:hypothetical protein
LDFLGVKARVGDFPDTVVEPDGDVLEPVVSILGTMARILAGKSAGLFPVAVQYFFSINDNVVGLPSRNLRAVTFCLSPVLNSTS